MNTDRFSIEEELSGEKTSEPDYQVKAMPDNDDNQLNDRQEEPEDEITSNETGHYDAADLDYETTKEDTTASQDK